MTSSPSTPYVLILLVLRCRKQNRLNLSRSVLVGGSCWRLCAVTLAAQKGVGSQLSGWNRRVSVGVTRDPAWCSSCESESAWSETAAMKRDWRKTRSALVESSIKCSGIIYLSCRNFTFLSHRIQQNVMLNVWTQRQEGNAYSLKWHLAGGKHEQNGLSEYKLLILQ